MYSQIIRNRIFIAICCLIIAGFISFKVVPAYVGSLEGEKLALVAKTNIVIGEKLVLDENVEFISFKECSIPEGILEFSELDNYCAQIEIFQKEFIIEPKVISEEIAVYEKESENVIVAVSFDGLAQSVAGRIAKNDKISVVSFSKSENKIIFEDGLSELLVIDVVDNNGKSTAVTNGKFFDTANSNQKRGEAAVISCDLEQAMRLIELNKKSELHFILTNDYSVKK